MSEAHALMGAREHDPVRALEDLRVALRLIEPSAQSMSIRAPGAPLSHTVKLERVHEPLELLIYGAPATVHRPSQ
jgi:hypothetical protein